MGNVEAQADLEIGDILPLLDDGTPRECACCAMYEGRTPKQVGPSLSENVMELAWPLLDTLEETEPLRIWQLAFLCAARAWNLAVEGHAEGSPAWLEAVQIPVGNPGRSFDLRGVVRALAERKRSLFPRDRRLVAEVLLSPAGELWCRPRQPPQGRRKAG